MSKTNLILAGVAVALAIPTTLQVLGDQTLFTSFEEIPKMFDGFTPDRVNVIQLSEPKAPDPGAQDPAAQDPAAQDPNQPKTERSQLVFARKEDGWVLGQGELVGAPVVSKRINDDVLDHIERIRMDPQTLVVERATDEQLRDYGLAEDQAFVIACVDPANQRMAELWIGNDARGKDLGYGKEVRGFFVRKGGDRDIVLYEVDYWRRSVKAVEWLDRTVHQLNAAQVQKFTLRNPKSNGLELVFEKKAGSEATWEAVQAPEGVGALRQSEVEVVLQRFLTVSATDIKMPLKQVPNPAALGLQPGQIEVSATTEDGVTHRLWLGNKVPDKNEYYMQSSDMEFLLTWAAQMISPFERDPSELFDPVVPKEDGGDKPPNEEAGKPGEADANENAGATDPKEKVEVQDPDEKVEATDPTKKVETTDPTKKVETTDPTKKVETTDPTKKVETTDPTKKVEATDPNKKAETTDPTKKVETTDPTKKVETTDPTKKVETTDPTKKVETTDPKKKVETTDPKKKTEVTDPAKKSGADPTKGPG